MTAPEATAVHAAGGAAAGTASPADRAARTAMAAYEQQPAGVWIAPGRVNLIGEHTDYNGGYVLPFALPRYTAVAAVPLDRPAWTVYSEQTGDAVQFDVDGLVPGQVTGWASYVAGVVWALRQAGYEPPGARLAIASDVPVGAGLASSAALECAVLTALVELGQLDVPLAARPGIAWRAEYDYVGVPCGIMDQSAAILGRAGYALFLDCQSRQIEHVPLNLAAAGLAMLLVDTRTQHAHRADGYAKRRATCARAATTLGLSCLRELAVPNLPAALERLDDEAQRLVRHVVTENDRVVATVIMLRLNRPRDIGPLLAMSHRSLRNDFEVTVPELDTAVDAAMEAGALGARMVGGGFGGCVLALVEQASIEQVAQAVVAAFDRAGFATPVCFPAAPSSGAARVS